MRSKWQHENDPTWLSDVEAQVATIIQRLLLLANNTLLAHISVDQIRRFKTLYSSIGLHCRYSSCKHRCVTYRSETERREHECTHVQSYKCMECDFAERPFTSRQDLRKHQAKYHTTPVDLAIPLQIRSLATKSLPPLRRKTQRLGIRESNAGLSPVDQTSPNDLRPTISNAIIDIHQDPQTIREYAAKPKDLILTDTSERYDIEALDSADLASTSCTESGVAHKLESVDKLKPVHSPRIFSMSGTSFPIGEPVQTAPETSHDSSLRIDHIGNSRQEPNTSNKNPPKDFDIVHVDDSTESILRFEDFHSEGRSVESCVSRYVQLAAKVHLEYHGRPDTARSVDEEARRIKGLIKGISPVGTRLEWDADFSCLRRRCASNLIGSYIAATFANENAIPDISKGDAEARLVKIIRGVFAKEHDTLYAFLGLRTTFLPQEMIRFECAIKLDGDSVTDLPIFLENLKMWGPQDLKDYVERLGSETNRFLDIDEKDIDDWLYRYLRHHSYDGSYLYNLPDWRRVPSMIRDERREAHSQLECYITSLTRPSYGYVSGLLNVTSLHFNDYVLSLLCKERQPTEMVKSLNKYLKSSK